MTELEIILQEIREQIKKDSVPLRFLRREISLVRTDTVIQILESYVDRGYDYANMDQPQRCVHGYAGPCRYPISECRECPARPENADRLFGMTKCEVE